MLGFVAHLRTIISNHPDALGVGIAPKCCLRTCCCWTWVAFTIHAMLCSTAWCGFPVGPCQCAEQALGQGLAFCATAGWLQQCCELAACRLCTWERRLQQDPVWPVFLGDKCDRMCGNGLVFTSRGLDWVLGRISSWKVCLDIGIGDGVCIPGGFKRCVDVVLMNMV